MVKKLKYLLLLIPFLFIPNVYAADNWTGVNWAATSPTSIQVFGYRNDNGSITYPYNTYQPQSVSAFQFGGFQPNGFGGYAYNYITGTDYSLLTYTNSINFVYENKQFTRDGDFVTLHGQIMPSNQQGIDILNILSWYVAVYYGADNPVICQSTKGFVNSMYFADFQCSFPRTNYISISLNFTNYTGSNQGASFMIRNDYSDVMYSNDNTGIITNSIGGASQDIINNQNSNTNTITQNQDTNTQNIINNQNSNTQDIINNQNQNTQQEIESQLVCKDSNSFDFPNSGYLQTNGSLTGGTDSAWATSSFVSVPFSITLKSRANSPRNICFYSNNNTTSTISCVSTSSYNIGDKIPIPTNTKYIRFTRSKSSIQPIYDLCFNGNQVLNDTLNDTSQPNTNQDINDMNNMVSSLTPITDLISMPLTLINAYINGVSATCSPINLGNLYGTDLILPCINLEQRLGSNLWGTIDAFFSIFMCYNIGMLFISAFDGITSLRDDFEGLYQPRHADTGYKPKHGGGN